MSPEVPQPGEIHTAEEISPRSTYERPALVRLDLRGTEFGANTGEDGRSGS